MNVSTWCIRNPIPTIVFFVLLTLGGLFAFKEIKIQLFPDIELPTITVATALPGAPPTQMETEVVRKIENAIANLDGLRHTYSTAKDGVGTVTAEFTLDKNTQEALDEVRQAVAQIRGDLPAEMESPIVTKLNLSGVPIVAYTISASNLDAQSLSWFVDDTLNKKLLAVPGVGSVARVGGVKREIAIELNTEKMQSAGLTAADVSQQLRQLQMESSAGRIQLGGVDQSLRTVVTTQTADDLRQLPIRSSFGAQTLGDIATITDTIAEVRSAAFLNGKSVVSIEVTRSKSASDVEVGEGVAAALEKVRAEHPNIEFVKAFDFYTPVSENYSASMNLLWEGALLAVFVVWLFLRDWRATLVSATALPLSVLPTALGLWLLDYSLNLPTLLALSLVIGILVDDAIVEVENIVRHMRMGKSPLKAASEAAEEIGMAVIATTFTIIAVFLPTAFMGGIPGKMFKQFSLTAVFAIFASLVVARMLTPMLAAYILKDKPEADTVHNGKLLKGYMRMVEWCVNNRAKTMLAALLFFILSLQLIPFLNTGFIPPDNNSQTQVHLELAPGSTLQQSSELAERTRLRLLEKIPYIQTVYTAVGDGKAGSDAFVGSSGSEPRMATLTITMLPRNERPRKQIIEAEIRALLETIPGARMKVGLGGSGEKYFVMLTGDDPQALNATAREFDKDLRKIPGLGNIASAASLSRAEIILTPKLDKAAELGISPALIAHTLRIATVGDYSSLLPRLNTSQRQVPIVVKLEEKARTSLEQLQRITIPSPSGPVLLGEVVDMKIGGGAAQINRYDRTRNISFAIELNDLALGDLTKQVPELASIKNRPPSVNLREVGDAEVMVELFNDFTLAMSTGVLCIFLVLILLFRSILQPITILMALPLSIGGAFIALLLTNSWLAMPSLIGLLMLMGVTTKNSILLVEYAIVARAERGLNRLDAILDACRKRAMPIIMTTIAMGAGMLPIALGWSNADQSFRSPMAWTVIGGLVTSTILSLLVIPVAYLYMDNFSVWLRRLFGRKNSP